MKNKWIRQAALALLLCTLLGLLPIFASTQPAVYSTTSNSGERDVICTTLAGTGAGKYYTGAYTYDSLSELSARQLYDRLEQLMTDTHHTITAYSDCRDYANKTDSENNDGRIVLIYTSYSATYSDYQGGNGWNREHVWPKSLGGFNQDGAGADLHHIRPSDNKVNGTRGNKLYGNVEGGRAVTGGSLVGASTVGGYSSGNYFEPLDNVKGDVARICLYLYVRWAEEYPKCGNLNNIFSDIDTLLEWCEEDPVDTWEMGRNEVVGRIQGNRNVFIDYPEYAWLLFDKEIPDDMITPSGEATNDNGSDPACTHKSTELRNATAASCGKEGYTGDTYCKSCGKKLQSGKVIEATGLHSFNGWELQGDGSQIRTCQDCGKVEKILPECKHEKTETRNASPENCGKDGYTGDIHCADCGKLILAGSTVPATGEHSFSPWTAGEDSMRTRTCTGCGKVESVKCEHTNTERRGVVEATCSEGYTGDTHCADCGILLANGTVAPPVIAEHRYGDPTPIEDTRLFRRLCTVCGHELINADGMDADTPTDSASFGSWGWILAAIGGCTLIGIGVAIVLLKRKKA